MTVPPPVKDAFDLGDLVSIVPDSPLIDSYQCMSDTIRKVYVTRSLVIHYTDGSIRRQTREGFFATIDTLIFLSEKPLGDNELSPVESAFVCMALEMPSKLFRDSFPITPGPIAIAKETLIMSTPSMLFSWFRNDTLSIRGDEIPSDCHADVAKAALRINKYMRVTKPLESVSAEASESSLPGPAPVQPIKVDISRKRPRDAREFREQILANGAQAEFYVWSLIKARYGDAADLSWWVTSAKRTFFPSDVTPIDDSIGSDFFIPKDDQCLFASKRGGPVHIEVKGTGRFCGANDGISFEISRNELQSAQQAQDRGQEYVVAVISGLAGINRPKLETVIRDLSQLELVPTRYLATVPRIHPVATATSPNPPHTKSSWY
jgi:hypothetical protein